MRSNAKDLGPLSRQWNSTFEGILLLKEKSDHYFKKSSYAFTERYCRLKGNLLLICRTPDKRCNETYGLLLLEGFQISEVQEKEVSNAFQLIFDSGDNPMVFAARSPSEREMWCRHLSKAGLLAHIERLNNLREEIKRRTGRDPLDTATNLDDDPDSEEEPDKNGIELSFSCYNLPVVTSNVNPNPCVVLSLKSTPQSQWQTIAKTEVAENNESPKFLKTLFIKEDLIDKSSQVKICINDYRDIRSRTTRQIAQITVSISHLMHNSPSLHFLCDTTGTRLPNAQIEIKAKRRQLNTNLSNDSDFHSVHFNSICENILSKSYNFPSLDGPDLKVVEYMGEPCITIEFPIEFLKKIIQEQHLLFDSLSRFASSKPNLERLRNDRLIGMKTNIECYENALRQLSDYAGPKFKPSREKNNPRLDFLPTNLHINRIAMLNEDNNLVLFHDVITTGAFAAHTLRFKGGGLSRIHTTYKDCLSEYAPCNQALFLIRSGLHQGQEICADLTSLPSRLQPGQEAPEAEKLEKRIRAIKTVYKDQFISDLIDLSEIHVNYDTLKGLLESVNSVENRKSWLSSIKSQSEQLLAALESAWSKAAEVLWPKVLEGLSAMGTDYETYQYRSSVTLSQCLTSVIAGLLTTFPIWSENEWRQMAVCGVPLHFEGLLSTYSDELGMLEDMSQTIDYLANVRIVVRPGSATAIQPLTKMLSLTECQVTCPERVWLNAPEGIRSRGRVKLHLQPYFFNVGINEQQTLADRLGKSGMQNTVNLKAYESLKAYFDRYTKHFEAPRRTCSQMEVYDALKCIKYEIDQGKNKPVNILELANEISWTLNAIRFTSCKSAKDRTSMSLTLEQVRWLRDCVGMKPEYFEHALECMRSTGLRRENAQKNTGSKKYAFSKIQLMSFPKFYKPPVGTYSLGQT